ncbi:MAG: type II secretion system protein [Burkholderiaceae bacterium]|nr:type II secretion system protein [Burkholderiaceae bacterium]
MPRSRIKPSPVHARNPHRAVGGFTLVELIVSMVLIGLLATTASLIWVNGFSLASDVDADSTNISETRAVLERVSREIREVKYDSTNAVYCITTATASTLTFRKSNAGAAAGAVCGTTDFTVTITNSGSNLNLTYSNVQTSTTPVLTSAVYSFAFSYYDQGFNLLSSPVTIASIHHVKAALTLSSAGGQTVSSTVVYLRND